MVKGSDMPVPVDLPTVGAMIGYMVGYCLTNTGLGLINVKSEIGQVLS